MSTRRKFLAAAALAAFAAPLIYLPLVAHAGQEKKIATVLFSRKFQENDPVCVEMK